MDDNDDGLAIYDGIAYDFKRRVRNARSNAYDCNVVGLRSFSYVSNASVNLCYSLHYLSPCTSV